jgi:urease accessory protein
MKKIIILASGLLFSGLIYAHPGHGENFMGAFMHPILGWDHLLTMLVIGMMVSSYTFKKGIFLPISFVSGFTIAAVAGASLNFISDAANWINQATFMTLILLSAINIFNKTISFNFLLAILGGFGLIHGLAHGLELPSNQPTIISGLILSTVVIHSIGFLLCKFISKKFSQFIRYFTLACGFIGAIALIQTV